MTADKSRLDAVLHLRSVDFFDGLETKELASVAAISSERVLNHGDVVFDQGAEGEHMFIITEGEVEVVKDGTCIVTLGPGDCFGEMAVLDRTTRSATIRVAANDTRLLTIAREDLQELLELYPSVARGVAMTLAARVRQAATRRLKTDR